MSVLLEQAAMWASKPNFGAVAQPGSLILLQTFMTSLKSLALYAKRTDGFVIFVVPSKN